MENIIVLLCSLKAQNRVGQKLCIDILDSVFEDLIRSMEENDFKQSQRRLLVTKFIAEAYNHKLVSTDCVFGCLYKFINYDSHLGQEDKHMKSYDQNSIDSFRVRLACTLLDQLGPYFWKGQRRIKMDRYLIYLQKYILSKSYI